MLCFAAAASTAEPTTEAAVSARGSMPTGSDAEQAILSAELGGSYQQDGSVGQPDRSASYQVVSAV